MSDKLREALREGARRMADILCEYGERGEMGRPFIAACSDWQEKAAALAAPEQAPLCTMCKGTGIMPGHWTEADLTRPATAKQEEVMPVKPTNVHPSGYESQPGVAPSRSTDNECAKDGGK